MGYVWEHLLVAEEALGEPIGREFEVHHLNGVRDDNRSENLTVVLPKDHPRNTVRAKLQERIRFLESEFERQGLPIP